jgi:hypothetical protein
MIAVLAACVFTFGVHASALHVHAYLDHDHGDHVHGLAVHEHVALAEEVHDEPHVAACDPSSHVVRISYTATASTDVRPGIADTPVVPALARALTPASVVQLLDVRGHGPPPSPGHPLRAPPLQIPLVRRSA